jgi:hypothetical protein
MHVLNIVWHVVGCVAVAAMLWSLIWMVGDDQDQGYR